MNHRKKLLFVRPVLVPMRCVLLILAHGILLLLALCLLTACGGGTQGGAAVDSTQGGAETGGGPAQKKLSVVMTIFPAYDWVRQILGDRAEDAEITLLLDSGVDLHSYQPSVADMVKASDCDLLIYVGGTSDAWVEDALASAVNRDMAVVNLLDVLGDAVEEEELVEGMEPGTDEAGHGGEAGRAGEAGHDGGGETEYDEHVWLSLRRAAVLCEAIAVRLGEVDRAHRDLYAANAAAYMEKLNALDARYAQTVENAAQRTVIFGDRFPFRYLADDYGLTYYAAFPGCSAETEASFETIVFLADKVDQLGLDAVLTTETADGRIARTIVENTSGKSVRLLVMDSMQSVTAQEIADGVTYLDIMERNLDTLRRALESWKG